MRLGFLYRKYVQNNLFIKIILLFSFITIVTIITFSYVMLRSLSETVINRELDNQKRAMDSVSAYMGSKYDSVQQMIQGVYRDSALSAGVTFLLEHPFQDYIRHNLDQYYENPGTVWTESLQYFKNKMDDDEDITNLLLYSTKQQSIIAYNQYQQLKIVKTDMVNTYVPDVMTLEGGSITLPNTWLRKAAGQNEKPLYSLRLKLNDKQTLADVGQLVVFFNANGIWKALSNQKEVGKGRILVLTPEGDILFDTTGQYERSFPHMEQIDAFYESSELVKGNYITKMSQSKGGLIIVGIISKEEMAESYRGLRNTIVTISLICILVAILIPSFFIIRFAKRTNEIIRFTKKVKRGDLTARIEDPEEDELGQISQSFNAMLDELNQYIDRVYKADIKQKETEISALQARINPHFLYNTLEVIRMRAVSQGAQDVGEMIYSLSALFRSYVRQKPDYTLKDELEACRLYLELFRIRYKDKFGYDIECGPELANMRILQMSLQPIVENYIVHGLRTDRTDNRVAIKAFRTGQDIEVEVKDNGKGIDPDRLAEIRRSLAPGAPEGESFGLHNVNERLQLLYGDAYGVSIESAPGEGTAVTVRLPVIEEEEEGADLV